MLIVLISCTGGNKTSDNTDFDVDVQSPIYVFMEDILQKEDTEPLSSIASEIVYIPLETNDNSLLKGVALNVVFINESYIVNDVDNIFLFDKDGKYIKRIAQRGGGPSDYPTQIYNVVADPETNYFYLFSTDKVIKFDEKANYIEHFSIPNVRKFSMAYIRGVFTTQKTMVLGLFNSVVQFDDTTTVFNAIEIDTIGHIINKYINHSPRYVQETRLQINSRNTSLYVFNNDVRFLDFGHDTIFSLKGDSMMPYAILDLGKNKTNLVLNLKTIDFHVMDDAIKNLSGHIIWSMLENDSYFFIELTKKGLDDNYIFCLFHKKSKELKLLKDNVFLNDIDGGISFLPRQILNNNELIGVKSAEKFKEEILSLDYNVQKTKYGERFEKVYQLAKSLREDDNPVLIIAKK